MRNPRLLAVIAASAIFAAAIPAVLFYRALNYEVHHDHSEEYILVEKGASTGQIVSKLASRGIIASPFAVRVYLRTLGDPSAIKAGEYKFKSPISALEVLSELEKGNERTVKLTVPEGWTRFEIAKRIVANFPTEPPTNEADVLVLMDDTTSVRDMAPNAKNLEGFLYPTTYSFPLETLPEEIVNRMVGEFRRRWQPDWTIKAERLGWTPYEIVTIASLIENESKVESERRLVASVIYNRLDRGMALGIDATNVYIAKILGKWDGVLNKSDFEVDHPYNTRKVSGLPPGPISSASESAIKAALDPASTNYLYYVLDVTKNDGSHIFYESSAEFERGKARYQQWLEEQRKNR